MLKFTHINSKNPNKTSSEIRSKNFDEIYLRFAANKSRGTGF